MMGELYQVDPHTINYHLKKIFSDSELEENAVTRNFRITAQDSKSYNINGRLGKSVEQIYRSNR